MSYDPLLEQRLADALLTEGIVPEPKKMFGGIAFLVNGHMSVGITNKGQLMVRFDPARHAELATWPGARAMDFTGKAMKGFLFVDIEAVTSKAALTKWVRTSLDFVSKLPAKKKAPGSGKPSAKQARPKTSRSTGKDGSPKRSTRSHR